MKLIRSTLLAKYQYISDVKKINHIPIENRAACFYDLVTYAKTVDKKKIIGELTLLIQKEITNPEVNVKYTYNNECIFTENEVYDFLESIRQIFNFSYTIEGFNEQEKEFITIRMNIDMYSTELRVFCPLIRHLYEQPWNLSLRDAIRLHNQKILNEDYNSLLNCIAITDMAITDFTGDAGYGHSMICRGLVSLKTNEEYKNAFKEPRLIMSSVFEGDPLYARFGESNKYVNFLKVTTEDYTLNKFSNESFNIKRLDYYQKIIKEHYSNYANL